MIHKMGFDFACERCGKLCSYDDCTALDAENHWCDECVDADYWSEHAYWKPRYEGEKLAGLLPERNDK